MVRNKAKLAQATRRWYLNHKSETIQRSKIWREKNPEKSKAIKRRSRKNHPHYEKSPLRRGRNLIRKNHQRRYRPFKLIVAPDSQIHHEWVPNSTTYRGVALVEGRRHRYGFIDVIGILDGEITLFSEKEIGAGHG